MATPKYVAIKRIVNIFSASIDAQRILREITILRHLKDDCIIQLLDVLTPLQGSVEGFDELYLVFEYVDTDLYKLIMSPQYLTTEHIQTFLYQLLNGLKHIHECSVIHRDLKPANILLNEDCTLKICDFGLARGVDDESMMKHEAALKPGEVGSPTSSGPSASLAASPFGQPPTPKSLQRQLTKHVVTRWYRAPELILLQNYTSAVDIWSLGCIFAELLSMQEGSVPSYQNRQPLFPGKSCFPLSADRPTSYADQLDQLNVIFDVIGTPSDDDISSIGNVRDYLSKLEVKESRSLDSLYEDADPRALNLLESMLKFNPKKRCTVTEALAHPFLNEVRYDSASSAAPLKNERIVCEDLGGIGELRKKIWKESLFYRERDTVEFKDRLADGNRKM
jgi:mitogen-activated protein kinase 1/3